MTRVQSQRTRQALLVVGQGPEEAPPPELLELYTEDGLAVDVGKDRTRARWRGTWVISPTEPYEQNDFVLDQDNLWILSDASLLGDSDQPTGSTTGAWTLMTVGGGMKWLGEYDNDVDYKNNAVVRHEGGVYIATGDIASGSEVPGAPPPTLATGTTKAGDAMYGGHNQPCRIMVKGQPVDPVPAALGGEVNIGEGIGSKYFKIAAVPGDVVTIAYEGGTISLFDGGSGDALFISSGMDPSPYGGQIPAASSPITFTVPSISAYHGDVPAHVCVEVGSDVTYLEWVGDDDAGVWEVIVDPPVEVVEPGGFKGDWDDDITYPAGSIVRHGGSTYGTEVVTVDIEPGVPAGSNFGGVIVGLQATTLNKLEDGVPRTFTWPDDAEIDSGGSLSIPIVIDFVSTLSNLNLHLVNALDSSVSWLVDGGGAFGGGPYQSDQGSTQDRFFNAGTYYGGTGNYVLTARADSDAVGTLTITATGGDLNPPDPPNPWVEL